MSDTPKTLADKMAELSPERRAAVEAETERLRAQLWPKTPGQEPAKLYAVDAEAQMSDQASPWVLTKTGRIQDLTDEDLEGFDFGTGDDLPPSPPPTPAFLALREEGNRIRAARAARIEQEQTGRFVVDGIYKGAPYRLSVGPVESGTDEQMQAYLDEIQKFLEEPIEDDDEWEIEFETSDPGDMATIARAYLNMTPEERADFDRDLPDARSELRAFIDSLDDDKETPDVQS